MSSVNRKGIRLPSSEYVGTRMYFVTACTASRRRVFQDGNLSSRTIESLRRIAIGMNFMVHAYCLMPDHVHILAEGGARDCNLITFISRWKQMTGFAARDLIGGDLWQKGFYDHVVRNGGPNNVAWYIWMNPVRAGIVAKPETYTFSGSFTMPWPASASMLSAKMWVPPWKALIGGDPRGGGSSSSQGDGLGAKV